MLLVEKHSLFQVPWRKSGAELNNKLLMAVFGSVAGITSMTQVSGAVITWSGANDVSGSSDVQTLGTYVDALSEDPSGTVTINTVPFLEGTLSGSNFSDGVGDIVVSGSFTANYVSGGDSATTDASYNTLLSHFGYGVYNSGSGEYGPLTVTLSVQSGNEYQVQLFVYQFGGNSDGAAITDPEDSNGPTLNSAGQFATGTFTASGSTQTFQIDGPVNGGAANIFNALQLREIATAVPEPASAGLMLLAGAGFLRRRRSREGR
jgi:hypothetical protein